MRTIKVTGKGQRRVRPDTIRVKIILKGVYPKYEETLRHSAQDTAKLRDLFTQLGFKETDLKKPKFCLLRQKSDSGKYSLLTVPGKS